MVRLLWLFGFLHPLLKQPGQFDLPRFAIRDFSILLPSLRSTAWVLHLSTLVEDAGSLSLQGKNTYGLEYRYTHPHCVGCPRCHRTVHYPSPRAAVSSNRDYLYCHSVRARFRCTVPRAIIKMFLLRDSKHLVVDAAQPRREKRGLCVVIHM